MTFNKNMKTMNKKMCQFNRILQFNAIMKLDNKHLMFSSIIR